MHFKCITDARAFFILNLSNRIKTWFIECISWRRGKLKKLFNLLFFLHINVRYMSDYLYKRVTRAWYINYDLIHLCDKNFSHLFRTYSILFLKHHSLTRVYNVLLFCVLWVNLENVIKNFVQNFRFSLLGTSYVDRLIFNDDGIFVFLLSSNIPSHWPSSFIKYELTTFFSLKCFLRVVLIKNLQLKPIDG